MEGSGSGAGAGSIPLTNGSGPGGPKTYGSDGSGFGSGPATLQNSGVECSGRERSAGVGERGGTAAPAPQGQAHQAAEARDRVQEGQISGHRILLLFWGSYYFLCILFWRARVCWSRLLLLSPIFYFWDMSGLELGELQQAGATNLAPISLDPTTY